MRLHIWITKPLSSKSATSWPTEYQWPHPISVTIFVKCNCKLQIVCSKSLSDIWVTRQIIITDSQYGQYKSPLSSGFVLQICNLMIVTYRVPMSPPYLVHWYLVWSVWGYPPTSTTGGTTSCHKWAVGKQWSVCNLIISCRLLVKLLEDKNWPRTPLPPPPDRWRPLASEQWWTVHSGANSQLH